MAIWLCPSISLNEFLRDVTEAALRSPVCNVVAASSSILPSDSSPLAILASQVRRGESIANVAPV